MTSWLPPSPEWLCCGDMTGKREERGAGRGGRLTLLVLGWGMGVRWKEGFQHILGPRALGLPCPYYTMEILP